MHQSVFDLLPGEVIHQILEKLPVRTLSVVSRVSRVFYNSCQDERLWKKEIIKCDKARGSSPILVPTAQPAGPDSPEPLVPEPRLCHSSLIWKDQMYVHGGHNTVRGTQLFAEVKNDLWKYKFDERQWEQMKVDGMPAKTEHSAVIYKNKMYLFGGYSGEYFTNSLYCFDFDTNVCSAVPATGEIPPERSAHVGVVYKDKMYVFGGWNGTDQNNDLYSFDFATLKWSRVIAKGPLPSARCSHAAVVSEKYNSLFIFAGYGGKTQKYLNDMCQFSFETESWTITEHTPPSPRSRMRLVEFNDKIYIFGGWNKQEHFNHLYQYDIARRRWKEVELAIDPSEGKIGQHSMVVFNNILYIFAGYSSSVQSSTNDLYAYRLSRPSAAYSTANL